MKIIEEVYKWARSTFSPQIPDTIVIHHALSRNCTAQDIHRWHLANGWKGIAYHFFIRKDGSIYRGRQEHHVGGGLLGSENNNKLQICLEGCYTDYTSNGKVLTEKEVPEAQMNALVWLIKDIKTRWEIKKIKGHFEYQSAINDGHKDCPGKYFYWDRLNNMLEDTLSQLRTIYEDADLISPWAREAVLWAYNKGIMSGDGKRFNPQGPLTREQNAVIEYLKEMAEWK